MYSPVDRDAQTRTKEVPIQPVAHGRPHLLMVTMGIALILYATWFYTGIEFLNTRHSSYLLSVHCSHGTDRV